MAQDLIDSIVDRPKVGKELKDTDAEIAAIQERLLATAQAAIQFNNAIGKTTTQAQFTKSTNDAAIATERLRKETANAEAAIIRQSKAQLDLQAKMDRATQASQKQAAATQKLLSPYQQLTKQLRDAENAASNIGATLGTNSLQFTNAARRVTELRAEVDAIEQPLGRFQRNVGNYGSAIAQGFGKAYNAIKVFANIVPGLGISGIFLLGFEAIKNLTEALGLFSIKASQASLANKDLVASVATTEYKKAVTNVTELRENIDLARKGFLDKNAVLNQYNETIGKTTGQVSSLNEAETALNKNAENYIKFTFLKAVANTALQKSAELAAKAAEDALKNPTENIQAIDVAKELVDNDTKASKFTDRLKSYYKTFQNFALGGAAVVSLDFFGNRKLASEQAAIRLKKSSDDLTKESNIQKKIFADYEEQAAKIAKSSGFNFFEDNKTGKDTTQKDSLAAINSLIEAEKVRNQLVQENDKSSYDERIKSTDEFQSKTIGYINQRKRIELDAENLTADARKAIIQNNVNDIQKTRLDATKQNQKLQDEVNKAYAAEQKKIYDSLTASEKARLLEIQDASNQRLQIIDKEKTDFISKVTEQYTSGKINAYQYNQQLYDIELATSRKRLELQIEAAKKAIEIQAAALAFGIGSAADLQKSTETLTKLEIDASNLVTKTDIDNKKKREAATKQLQEKEKELADALINFGKTVIDANFENQQTDLKNQGDKIDKQLEIDRKAVEKSLLSDKDKADKTAILDAQAQARKDALDERSRELKKQQAVADRAFNIVSIIENTAVAISKTLAEGGILFSPLVGVIAALGALQIATILATPLPSYADGTPYHKGGLARFGEAGTELIIEPNKSPYLTSGDTIGYLPRGTEVVSNRELVSAMANPGKSNYVSNQLNLSAMIDAQYRSTDRLEKAFSNQVNHHTSITKGGIRTSVKSGGKWNNYLKRNIN